jgi:LacI family transcriptional regulator
MTPKAGTKPVRMKDIAQDLGLSVVTVSKVFRGHRDISEATRRRVLERIEALNYRPNLAARSLATGRSYTMGLIAPDLVHPFFSETARYLADAVRAKGYHLLIASTYEDPRIEQEEIEHMLSRRVDLLIIASAQPDAAGLETVLSRKIPLVLMDRRFPGFAASFVGVDDELVGRMATRHLLEQGCKLVAFIGTPFATTAHGRMVGYRQTLEEAGFEYRPEYVITRAHGDDTGDERGYASMRHLLTLRPRPDAVFCYNDPTAMGALKAILEHGLRIPRDIAVVGCGNLRYSDFLRVPLTSVDQDCAGLGQRTARVALELVKRPTTRPRIQLVEPRLVVRESSLRQRS